MQSQLTWEKGTNCTDVRSCISSSSHNTTWTCHFCSWVTKRSEERQWWLASCLSGWLCAYLPGGGIGTTGLINSKNLCDQPGSEALHWHAVWTGPQELPRCDMYRGVGLPVFYVNFCEIFCTYSERKIHLYLFMRYNLCKCSNEREYMIQTDTMLLLLLLIPV